MKVKEKRKMLDCWKPGYTKQQITGMGYTFSRPKYLVYFVGLYGCIAMLAYAFRLRAISFLVIAAMATALVPGICILIYRTTYEEKKFADITAYMEQILYSFKRNAKILTSLEDTQILFTEKDSRLYNNIADAIGYIQTAEAGTGIYKDAFALIEEQYGCERLYKIHDFLIEAEEVGGDFSDAVDILLKDRKLWVDRVYELQREKKNVKVKMTIGIALSFLICGMSTVMLPKEFGITDQLISQAVTVITVLLNLLIWYVGQKKLSKSLLWQDGEADWADTKRYYDYIMYKDRKREQKRMLLLAVTGAVIIFGLGTDKGTAAVMAALFGIFFGSWPKQKYRMAMRRVTKEVEKVFPGWLMSMSLQLQTDNLHVSLEKTIPRAPEILSEELKLLLERIEYAPDEIQPYLSFMSPVYLPDMTSAMKVLYSMAEYGTADISGQLGPLIERGEIMTDKAERLKAEDYIAGVSFLVLLPMLTGVIKMLADLALVVVYILSVVNQAV